MKAEEIQRQYEMETNKSVFEGSGSPYSFDYAQWLKRKIIEYSREMKALTKNKARIAELEREVEAGDTALSEACTLNKHLQAEHERLREQLFYQGFAVAIADLMRHYDQPTMALNIMKENGITFKQLKKAHCSDFDLKVIQQALAGKEEK